MNKDRIHVLVVEDEPAIMELITFTLKAAGWQPVMAETVEAAVHILARMNPDVILLDWMLPDESGLSLLKRLRADKEKMHVPVIMLTARSEEQDRVKGLDGGADDYITKPFSTKELVARINAVLRRKIPDRANGILQLGDVELDPASHRVTVRGEPVDLGKMEFRLLRFFLAHPRRVFSRQQILDRIWQDHQEIEERTVDVQVLRLRRALGESGELIRTVRGAGYMATDET